MHIATSKPFRLVLLQQTLVEIGSGPEHDNIFHLLGMLPDDFTICSSVKVQFMLSDRIFYQLYKVL